MRKAIYIFLVVASVLVTSCENKHQDAVLQNDVDSLSYAIGKLNGMDMKVFLREHDIDQEDISEVIKGIQEGMASVGDKRKFAFYFGVLHGLSMMENANKAVFQGDSTQSLSQRVLIAGLLDGLTNQRGAIANNRVKAFVDNKSDEIVGRRLIEQYGNWKAQSEQFIADKAKTEGISKLRNGIYYTPVKTGAGVIPRDTSMVVANMELKTIDGQVISSSWKDNKPFTDHANQTIPGVTEALVHMPTGSIWEVYIPWQQGYGVHMAGNIKPFSALICKIQLIEVK